MIPGAEVFVSYCRESAADHAAALRRAPYARREWLALLEGFDRWFDAIRPWDEVEPVQRHFRVASSALSRWLDRDRDAEVLAIARDLALRLALLRLEDDAGRPLRYMAAEWSAELDAGEALP
jgi:hypothetical protein